MSRKKGTAEKWFSPIYLDGQDAADFEKRAWKNEIVAREGVTVHKKYTNARLVKFSWQVIKSKQAQIKNRPDDPAIEGWKRVEQAARAHIHKFIDDALETNDANSFRLLAEVLENVEPRSKDALLLIQFCLSKPHTYVFTFKELYQAYAASSGRIIAYDQAIEKRVRRLIKMFGIRTRKGQ